MADNVGGRVGISVGRSVGSTMRVGAGRAVAVAGASMMAVEAGLLSIWATWELRKTIVARQHERVTTAKPLPMRIVFGDKS